MNSADYLNNPVASHLEDIGKSFEELKELETSYQEYYARALVSPFYEGPDFWPEARAVFASLQQRIDALRLELGLPILWFTEDEIRDMNKGITGLPDEPRNPYKLPTQPEEEEGEEEEEEEEEDEEVPQTVTMRGRTTITLDTLIEQLMTLRHSVGGDAPVWHTEFGGITETRGAEEWKGGVVIA